MSLTFGYPVGPVPDPVGCAQVLSRGKVLFDVGETHTHSQNFTVHEGEVVMVSAMGLGETDCIAIDEVAGCGAGEYAEQTKLQCGCCALLNCKTTRLVLPFPGRYRARVVNGTPGGYRIVHARTAETLACAGSCKKR